MRLIDADALGIGLCKPDIFVDKAYAAGWNEVVRLIKSASTVSPLPLTTTPGSPRWISVKDKLPERNGWYLAYGPQIKHEVMHFNAGTMVWANEHRFDVEVTHWMPLPEPPEEEQK